jgi:polyribonucleotide nucleotidyltransferase
VIDAIIKLAEKAAKEPRDFQPEDHSAYDASAWSAPIWRGLQDHRQDGALERGRQGQGQGQGDLLHRRRRRTPLGRPKRIGRLQEAEAKVVRGNILKTKSRIDGRDLVDRAPIVSEVGFLPRTHGSALFTRGETQAIVVATLGTGEDEQLIDGLDGDLQGELHAALQLPALLGR